MTITLARPSTTLPSAQRVKATEPAATPATRPTATPRVRVYAGSRRPVPAIAHQLTSEEATAALTAYALAHPRAWAALRPVFETTRGARIDSDGTSLPLIALDLAGARPGGTL